MKLVAVDWDDTCRDTEHQEFKWMPGAEEALRKLNGMPDVHCFILTARPPKGTLSIQYQLQAHGFHNISVKCSAVRQEYWSKKLTRFDYLIDDAAWSIFLDEHHPGMLILYEGRHSWDELFDHLRKVSN